MYNTNLFLKWNWNNNINIIKFNKNNNNNYKKLYEFIEKKYDCKNFLKDIRYIKKAIKQTNTPFIKNTLRMTTFELLI